MSKKGWISRSDVEKVCRAIQALTHAENNNEDTYYGEASVKLMSLDGYTIATLYFVPEAEEWVADFKEYGEAT